MTTLLHAPATDAERLHRRANAARRRVSEATPFSPSWDAAMAELEDAERDLWRLESADGVVTGEVTPA